MSYKEAGTSLSFQCEQPAIADWKLNMQRLDFFRRNWLRRSRRFSRFQTNSHEITYCIMSALQMLPCHCLCKTKTSMVYSAFTSLIANIYLLANQVKGAPAKWTPNQRQRAASQHVADIPRRCQEAIALTASCLTSHGQVSKLDMVYPSVAL